MNEDFYELHASLCGTFSSPKRLEILNLLRDGELTVTEIQAKMDISKTNLSQHLTMMKDRGILKSRREGQHIYYSVVNEKVIQAYDLMSEVLRELIDKRMTQLG